MSKAYPAPLASADALVAAGLVDAERVGEPSLRKLLRGVATGVHLVSVDGCPEGQASAADERWSGRRTTDFGHHRDTLGRQPGVPTPARS